jgi:mannose-6-phosphate isomerase-like protein (cupin superfamily)
LIEHVKEFEVRGDRAPAPNLRTLKHLIAPWTVGSKQMWMGMSEVDLGSCSNRHSHGSEECFYVLSGKGTIEVGEEQVQVAAGSAVLVPANTEHRLVNDGQEVLKVLCCAAPPFALDDFEARHLLDGASKTSST